MKRLGMVLVATLVVVMGLALAGPASAGTTCYPSCPTSGGSNGTITAFGALMIVGAGALLASRRRGHAK